MHLSPQDTFLKKLETALCDVSGDLRKTASSAPSERDSGRHSLERVHHRTKAEQLALLDMLKEESLAINLNVLPVKDEDAAGASIQQLVKAKQPEQEKLGHVVAWRDPLLEKLNLDKRLGEISVPIFFTEFSSRGEKATLREKMTKAFLGVTSADFCIADSATLVLKTRPGQARSVSLAPAVHVAVITLDRILACLDELYALLKYDPAHRQEGLTRCMTFITGPSKTADIEAVMVHGVHGPREVYLYVITG